MKTKQIEIDIDELKKEAVHSGLLEAILYLGTAFDIISQTMDDKDVKQSIKALEKLDKVYCDILSNREEIGDVIGILFTDRIDNCIEKRKRG